MTNKIPYIQGATHKTLLWTCFPLVNESSWKSFFLINDLISFHELMFNESIGTRLSKFSYSFIVRIRTIAYYAYLNFQDKNIKPFSNANIKFVVSGYFLVFCWGRSKSNHGKWCHHIFKSFSWISIEWKFEKTSIDVNVFQRSHEKKLIEKVVHIRMAQSIWDHQMSPNLRTFAIYLKLVHTFRNKLEKFDEC